jgi:hypothetical protein
MVTRNGDRVTRHLPGPAVKPERRQRERERPAPGQSRTNGSPSPMPRSTKCELASDRREAKVSP